MEKRMVGEGNRGDYDDKKGIERMILYVPILLDTQKAL